jgi:hypothetical protein
VKSGNSFPSGALDYSGAGLTAPGEHIEMWLKLDPGNYILICWNANHATTVPVHTFSVIDDHIADDTPPKKDVVLKLVDYRFELVERLRWRCRLGGAVRSGLRVQNCFALPMLSEQRTRD